MKYCNIKVNLGGVKIPALYIAFNGTDGTGYYGLNIFYPQAGYEIRNNTVIYNANEGVFATEPSNPVLIRNCILWGNQDNDRQLLGNVSAQYSCVYDPNHPNQTTPDATTHNISCNPKFAHDGAPNVVIYHLLNDSPCIDMGDPSLSYDGQTDIDNNARIAGMAVEMGADEVDCMGVYNEYDTNADGIVNLYEYQPLAKAWLSHDPNDPAFDPNDASYNPNLTDPNHPDFVTAGQKAAWNSTYDLVVNHKVDIADLEAWLAVAPWLWQACWLDLEELQQQQGMMMSLPEQNQQMMTRQIEAMPMETQLIEMPVEAVPMETVAEIAVPEKSIVQQLADIKDTAKWLEELWETEPELQHSIDAASWKEFMDAVYKNMEELEQLNAENISMSEELQ